MKCEVLRQFNAIPKGGIVEPPGTYRDYLIARGFIRPAVEQPEAVKPKRGKPKKAR